MRRAPRRPRPPLPPRELDGAGPSPTKQAIETRKAAYTLIGNYFRQLGAVAKGTAPYDEADATKRAARIAFLSNLPGEAFPDVSNVGEPDTKAKADVWTNRADFDKRLKDFQAHAVALVQVNATEKGATDGFKAAVVAARRGLQGLPRHLQGQVDFRAVVPATMARGTPTNRRSAIFRRRDCFHDDARQPTFKRMVRQDTQGAEHRLVWDWPVRLFHWKFVAAFVGAFVTNKLGVAYFEYHVLVRLRRHHIGDVSRFSGVSSARNTRVSGTSCEARARRCVMRAISGADMRRATRGIIRSAR